MAAARMACSVVGVLGWGVGWRTGALASMLALALLTSARSSAAASVADRPAAGAQVRLPAVGARTRRPAMGARARGPASGARPPCPEFCAPAHAPELTGLERLDGPRARIFVLLHGSPRLELMVARVTGGRLVAARPALIQARPREVLAGSLPARARLRRIAAIRLRRLRPGLRSVVVKMNVDGRPLAPGLYVLRVDAITPTGTVRARGSALVIARRRDGRIVELLAPHHLPPPRATTAGAGSVDDTAATLVGLLVPGGLPVTYYFQYGAGGADGKRTPARRLPAGRRPVVVSATVTGLSSATTYRYRLVATQCGGCGWGSGDGSEIAFTTTFPRQVNAARAVATYDAMQRYFYAADVQPGNTSDLYLPTYPDRSSPTRYSPLWPFSRALAGTITLSGIPSALRDGASYDGAVAERLLGLSRYWDPSSSPPGYDSEPLPPYGPGAAKYYDDQAWVGLALAQDYALTGDPDVLEGAESVFAFVYPGGWAATAGVDPGGIFWTQQGSGLGRSNHTRTTTSTVPNAELALLLAGFAPAQAPAYETDAAAIYGWAEHYLYNVAGNPNFDPSEPALMFDKVGATGIVGRRLRTYNQGAMIAAAVRMYQASGQAAYLSQAQAIATAALRTFTQRYYAAGQPPAFDVIFFRALLVLYSVCDDQALRSSIIQTIQTYANRAWEQYRSAQGLFRFPSARHPGYELLTQGAMLELYAALAWNPDDYGKLPS